MTDKHENSVEQVQQKKRLPAVEGLFKEPESPGESPHLIGSKCKQCGFVAFPKNEVCPVCLIDGTMEELLFGERAKLDSFAISRVAPKGFTPPYIQAFVDLPEGPRIFSIITGCEPTEDALQPGTELELTIGKICDDEEGNERISYLYRPVTTHQDKTKGGKQ